MGFDAITSVVDVDACVTQYGIRTILPAGLLKASVPGNRPDTASKKRDSLLRKFIDALSRILSVGTLSRGDRHPTRVPPPDRHPTRAPPPDRHPTREPLLHHQTVTPPALHHQTVTPPLLHHQAVTPPALHHQPSTTSPPPQALHHQPSTTSPPPPDRHPTIAPPRDRHPTSLWCAVQTRGRGSYQSQDRRSDPSLGCTSLGAQLAGIESKRLAGRVSKPTERRSGL
ncbi:serine/arginine repetitive matrix protein 1-like [Hyalella azteca]|uniref:Serine/arginine repetitive matrix protein 1-like n=1 Tax=Hyalella azteca TaxID=294128 RepID=A0A8B7P5A2_HYAAZ|nr:serine/arginine repetitive matrix protein 1-like [Hyalella azteca]